MIITASVPSMTMVPTVAPSSSFAISPSERPSRRVEMNRTRQSCTAGHRRQHQPGGIHGLAAAQCEHGESGGPDRGHQQPDDLRLHLILLLACVMGSNPLAARPSGDSSVRIVPGFPVGWDFLAARHGSVAARAPVPGCCGCGHDRLPRGRTCRSLARPLRVAGGWASRSETCVTLRVRSRSAGPVMVYPVWWPSFAAPRHRYSHEAPPK